MANGHTATAVGDRRLRLTSGGTLALIAVCVLVSLVLPWRFPLHVYVSGYVFLAASAAFVGARWVLEAFPRRRVEVRKLKSEPDEE